MIPDGTGFLLIDYLVTLQWGYWQNALSHLILPAMALALGFSPLVIRVLRSSLLEASEDHYVTVARQRGLNERQIILAHMLRNSALPTITLIGAQFGFLFGGTLLVETIFSYPGIGNLMVQAVRNHDLPLIQGIALVFCVTTLADQHGRGHSLCRTQSQAPACLSRRGHRRRCAEALRQADPLAARGDRRGDRARDGDLRGVRAADCAERSGQPGSAQHAAAADVGGGRQCPTIRSAPTASGAASCRR